MREISRSNRVIFEWLRTLSYIKKPSRASQTLVMSQGPAVHERLSKLNTRFFAKSRLPKHRHMIVLQELQQSKPIASRIVRPCSLARDGSLVGVLTLSIKGYQLL